jgi:hypothetical protein
MIMKVLFTKKDENKKIIDAKIIKIKMIPETIKPILTQALEYSWNQMPFGWGVESCMK